MPSIWNLRSISQEARASQDGNGRTGKDASHNGNDKKAKEPKHEERGAMSQRLEQMTDDSITEIRSASKNVVQEAGFSEELKSKLEERIAAATFRSENAQAFATAGLSVSDTLQIVYFAIDQFRKSNVGQGTRDLAYSTPWTGAETTEDSVLRMLVDTHKPLKGPQSSKPSAQQLPPVDTKITRRTKHSPGQRLANARDRSSSYSFSRDPSLSEKEKQQMRADLKERFTPGARPMPASVQGIRSLANERIEDAIGRGLFKNLPRGKEIERDYNASSPFIDTTEYLLNRLVQRQDIVPPWIEKQQELAREIDKFRTRLRNDWKRHASRMIASKGGSLRDQIRRAEAYAEAEAVFNPKPTSKAAPEKTNLEQTAIPLSEMSDKDVEEVVEILTEAAVDQISSPTIQVPTAEPKEPLPHSQVLDSKVIASAAPVSVSAPQSPPAVVAPFRDPDWEKLERSYHELSITSLNNLTRSYNLMAPDLAKKPYFSLAREISAAFRDVASQLPEEIHCRATQASARVGPHHGSEPASGTAGGVLDRFSRQKAHVWDERKPQYGLREFLRDLWG